MRGASVAQDEELLAAMHIPVDGEQVDVVEVSEETELVDAALTSLGGSADDEMDEVRKGHRARAHTSRIRADCRITAAVATVLLCRMSSSPS